MLLGLGKCGINMVVGEYKSDVHTITGGHSINVDVGNWAGKGSWNQIIK